MINLPGAVEVHACCSCRLPEDVCVLVVIIASHALLVGRLGTSNSLLFGPEFPPRATTSQINRQCSTIRLSCNIFIHQNNRCGVTRGWNIDINPENHSTAALNLGSDTFIKAFLHFTNMTFFFSKYKNTSTGEYKESKLHFKAEMCRQRKLRQFSAVIWNRDSALWPPGRSLRALSYQEHRFL